MLKAVLGLITLALIVLILAPLATMWAIKDSVEEFEDFKPEGTE